MALPRTVPYGGEFRGPNAIAGFLEHFTLHRLGWGLVHLGPAAGEGPAAVINGLPHQKDAARGIEHRTANADLGGGVTGFGREQVLDADDFGAGVCRHDARGEGAEGAIAFGVVRVFGEGQSGLCRGLDFAGPDKPIRLGIQHAVSGTNASRSVGLMSASVSMRHVPPISTSLGRKRDL